MNEIEELKAELTTTKDTLRTLITWLDNELGRENTLKLLDQLSGKPTP